MHPPFKRNRFNVRRRCENRTAGWDSVYSASTIGHCGHQFRRNMLNLMKSKPVETIETLSELVEALCKQVEGMTPRQKEELRAELSEYFCSEPSPRWLN